MNSITIFGHTFDHLSIVRQLPGTRQGYLVKTDEGYCINKPAVSETIYKTVTSIYEDDDFDSIIIIPVSELPEGAELMGGETKPETETE